MASSAAMTTYRDETIMAFEQRMSLFRATVTTEHMQEGNVATFLVAGSGDATPVTRGLDGRIPGRNNDLTQNSCTLVEWHDKPTYTGFNAFESQGDARRISQDGCVAVMNRKIDSDILGSNGLGAATGGDSSAQTASLDWIMGHFATLGENDVELEEMDKIFCAITPRAWSLLYQVKEFASGDYVEIKPFAGPARKFWNVAGINFIRSTRLSGMGTASATCFMWHRDAIGHAIANGHPSVVPGYNQEDEYEYVRCTGYFGSKLLQDGGVRKLLHNDTA